MKQLLTLLLLLTAATAWADAPMKTVYQNSSSTKFVWQWPYHTTRHSVSYQTYPTTSSYRQVLAYTTTQDVSQYRFHNPQLTYRNQWGYFFPTGTRPVKVGNGSAFRMPQGSYIPAQ